MGWDERACIAFTVSLGNPQRSIAGDIPLSGGTSLRRNKNLDRQTRVDRYEPKDNVPSQFPINSVRKRHPGPAPGKTWSVGDKVKHNSFGTGDITHIFGTGEKISIAVKFSGMGPKILDPRLAPIEIVE